MGLALSTSWNAFKHTTAEPLIREIKEAGFQEVELSFNLTSQIVDGVETLSGKNEIRVVSLHNYCPFPEDFPRDKALPDCYSMASCDEDERRRAVFFSQRTIETASRLGAKAVVLHCGRVEMPDATRELIRLFISQAADSDEFKNLRSSMIERRRSQAGAHLKNCLKSLSELERHAQKNKVGLGVETRFYYREIPSYEEIGIIFEEFKGSNIFYWHDTGHAQFMEDLGFLNHKELIERFKGRLLGIHLHDIIAGQDHYPPSKGKIDFSWIAPHLKEQTIKVVEAHYPATTQEIRDSKAYLEALLNGKS